MGIVSFRHAGRYGNQLFEIAATYAYAKRHNLEFSVPTKTNDPFWQPVYYTHLANPKWIEGKEDVLLNENWTPDTHYSPIPFREEWRGSQIVLNGYYQSEKYFSEYRQDILNLFGFNNAFPKNGYTAIFVRRGDYLKNPNHHPPVTIEYIKAAMDYVTEHAGKQIFLVCSDDIQWCYENIVNTGYDVEFSTGLPFDIEMKLMGCCEHQIGSNSTFSWWSAWMNSNPNKICIAPKDWFGFANAHLNTKDMCPENWIRL